jgi:Tol biopolymer transport system component/DNA-binding winged helix-turn-helix (wHTH) protein
MADGARFVYQFAAFRLDATDRLLYRDGLLVPLPPKVFDTLTILVANSGHVVGKDELMKQLWPDTFVAEGTLTQNISLLRKALGEGGKWIENHPRRGYRFTAPVAVSNGDLDGVAIEQPAHSAPLQPIAPAGGRRGPLRKWLLAAALAGVLSVAAWFASRWSWSAVSGSELSSRSALLRLTSTSGLNTDPALSADGTFLAYSSDRGGTSGFDIWVQPVRGGDALQVSSLPGDETEPSFSPDGAQIVFSDLDSGALSIVGALGGEPRAVVRAQWARGPRFSPDGKWIAYWRGFLPPVVPRGLPGATGSVFIVPSRGGSPRQVAPHFASARFPVWSPDSRHLLFLGEQSADEDTYDWYVAALDSSAVTKTGAMKAFEAAGLTKATPVPGAWRSRDDAVVFSSNEADTSNIWQIPVSPSTGRASSAARRLTFGTAIERGPAAASSGEIAFASVIEKTGVWRAPLDAESGIATGPFERVTDGAASDRLRNLSSDGALLAFISSRTRNDEVWIKDLHTGRERQLTHAGSQDASLAPNGETVAFSTTENGKHRIEMVDAAGALTAKFCDDCRVPSDWSPDGKLLLFHRGLPSQLVARDILSGREALLTSHDELSLFQARFSPDGAWVAFHTADAPEVRKVYAARVSLERPIRPDAWVPLVSDHGCHPNWSLDGALLYHFSFRDGAFCPWVQRVDPISKHPVGPPRAVQHLHDPRLRAALGAAATNDVQAGFLYITATETTGNVWMLDPERIATGAPPG